MPKKNKKKEKDAAQNSFEFFYAILSNKSISNIHFSSSSSSSSLKWHHNGGYWSGEGRLSQGSTN